MNVTEAQRMMPVIAAVQALKAPEVSVTWGEGARAGAIETINLAPLIASLKFYRRLRKDRALFATAHVTDDGNAIAWGDGSIDMSATAIQRLAEESMSAVDFKAFLGAHQLTQDAAAAILGRSRRQIANYLATDRIPRVVGLACYGYAARKDGFELTKTETNSPVSPKPPEAVLFGLRDETVQAANLYTRSHLQDEFNIVVDEALIQAAEIFRGRPTEIYPSSLLYPIGQSNMAHDLSRTRILNEAPRERTSFQIGGAADLLSASRTERQAR